ncbi:hypothetical protein ACLKA6_012001 [Drosophila palustris]
MMATNGLDNAPMTITQEHEDDQEAKTTEETRPTGFALSPIPPELEPHVNEADDDDESKPRTKQADEPDLEPWVRKFLESEPAQCETLTGVTHITEHVITMKDDRPIKQRYYQKNPCNASLMTRSTNY